MKPFLRSKRASGPDPRLTQAGAGGFSLREKERIQGAENGFYALSTRTSRYESRSESGLVSRFAIAVRAALHGCRAASKNECLTRAGKAVLTGWDGMPARPLRPGDEGQKASKTKANTRGERVAFAPIALGPVAMD